MTEEKKKKTDGISRRDFLKDAGLLVGGTAIGSTVLLAACSGETTTETVTNTATVTSTAPGSTSTVTSTLPGSTSTKTVTATPTGEADIEVLNPEGQVDPIELKPLAPRLDTLDGKTIYIVDVHFTATHQFMEEMEKIFNERYPTTTTRLKIKAGSYAATDPDLWAEIAEQGDGMVLSVGH